MNEETETKAPELINFDGNAYKISDLTPEIALMFNTLLRINRELEEAAYIVQRTQGSQAHYIKEIKKGIVDADISPVVEAEEVEEEVKEEDGDK